MNESEEQREQIDIAAEIATLQKQVAEMRKLVEELSGFDRIRELTDGECDAHEEAV